MEIAIMEKEMKIKIRDMEIEQLRLAMRQRDTIQENSELNSSAWSTF